VAGDDVVVTVCDTGQGIPADQLPSIFDRFYRVDDSRSAADGFGLGLAIAKRQIDAIGATVTVESELGKGTTFRLRLPGSAV
jgi:two-component system sensor histidine kinase BaeS